MNKRANSKKKKRYTPAEIAEFNRLHDLKNPDPLSGLSFQTSYNSSTGPVNAKVSKFFKGK